MAFDPWFLLHALVTLSAVGIYLFTTRSLHQRRHPSAAIAWLLSLLLIPYAALPIYFLFGNRKVPRPVHPQPFKLRSEPSQAAGQALNPTQTLAGALGLPPPCAYSRFELHTDGAQALASLLALIEGARNTLEVSTFLLGRDAVGEAVCARLVAKAQAGVRVRLMVDGVGRYLGGYPNLKRLRQSGVEVLVFIPPFSTALPGRTNLRNHRKMLIADGQRMWTGGRNLAQEYFDHARLAAQVPVTGEQGMHRRGGTGGSVALAQGRPVQGGDRWQDLSFELHGDIAQQAQTQFEQDWAMASARNLVVQAEPVQVCPAPSQPLVQLVPSGPDQSEDTVHALLLAACYAAKCRIVAVTPYFVPDASLVTALSLAARRGVKVDILLPRRSNHPLADVARMAFLRELQAVGVRIWLRPTMIHAKAIVFDEELALAGSANLDERSLFLNFELMIAFYQATDVQAFAHWIEAQRQSSNRFTSRPPSLAREFIEGVVRWLAFQL